MTRMVLSTGLHEKQWCDMPRVYLHNNMAPQSLNLVSLVVVDKRTEVLATGRDRDLQVRISMMSWTPDEYKLSLKAPEYRF